MDVLQSQAPLLTGTEVGETSRTGARQAAKKDRVLDIGLKKMSECWSSLITGRRRWKKSGEVL